MTERHHDVTRLEGFSDAVFGFALTLLVVSLEVPNTVAELMGQIRGFLAFALTFAMVCWIWYEHNVFFRRYGLQDPLTVFLNALLLFVVLFYVYPLKFLTQALLNEWGWTRGAPGAPIGPHFESAGDGAVLITLYSAGVVAIFAVFVLLHRHAWGRRDQLGLSPAELVTLRYSTRAHALSTALGVVSLGIVAMRPGLAGLSGMLYALMGPLHAWNGYRSGKAHEQLRAAEARRDA
jgi:hypothetical protein